MSDGIGKHEFEFALGSEYTAMVGADGVMALYACGVMDVPAVAAALKTAHDCGFNAATLLADQRIARLEQNIETGQRLLVAARDERDELRAEVAQLKAPVSELALVSIRIRELTSIILSHRCSEYSKPDPSCGDGGTPPCKWADIAPEDFCENCMIANKAKAERTIAKRRRSALVRRIAARAAEPGKEPQR